MKSAKTIFIHLILLISITSFISCENENNKTELQEINTKEPEKFDFSTIETIFEDGTFQEIENGLIKESGVLNDLEGMSDNSDTESLNLEYINEYLSYLGKKSIDTEAYYNKGLTIIQDPDSTIDEFTSFLEGYGIYSKAQLLLFKNFDAIMSKELSQDNYKNAVEKFKINIRNSNDLSRFEKNTMLIYAGIINAYVHSNNFAQEKSPCSNCIKKNKWKIFGWGLLFLLAAIIPCLAAGPWAILCIILVAGIYSLAAIKSYCGAVCPWI